tara:strand:- start:14656 stop:15474 length:819 start_codon:yes stop_codon:yes gene_type:complete
MSELCKRYINDVSKKDISLLSLEQELNLAKKIKKGCKQSLNELVYHNLRLVIKTSQRYEGCGVDQMDLINEGNIGLVQAAKKYKASKGTKFSTYAGFWIRQRMIRYINNHGRTIRIPCHAYAIFSELKKEYQRLLNNDENMPSLTFLASKFNCTEKKIKSLLPYLEPMQSIDSLLGEDGEETQERHIPSVELDANKLLQNKEKIQLIQKALKTLTKREKYIIEHRFGLHGDKKETLETIGKKFKVTRERIRQIENAALFKLKNFFEGYKGQI